MESASTPSPTELRYTTMPIRPFPTVSSSQETPSFSARMAAEEKSYAALMAQAKSSLERIRELGEGLGGGQEPPERDGEDTGMGRATELLSRIETHEEVKGAMGMDEDVVQGGNTEGEDSTMGGADQLEYRTGAEDRMDESDTPADGGDFPELMERAKKLLARITMNGDDQQAATKEIEAQARHDRAVAKLWGPM